MLVLPLFPVLEAQVLPETDPEMGIHGQVIYRGGLSGEMEREWERQEREIEKISMREQAQVEFQTQPDPVGNSGA